jgi:hypothetical protein
MLRAFVAVSTPLLVRSLLSGAVNSRGFKHHTFKTDVSLVKRHMRALIATLYTCIGKGRPNCTK